MSYLPRGGSFPWRSVWKVKVPFASEVSYFFLFFFFFLWTTTHGKILTLDNLKKRGVLVVEWCCMCKRGDESIDHLLLRCEVARDLWSAIFTLFGVHWVMPARVV
jgi:hypothetical protein